MTPSPHHSGNHRFAVALALALAPGCREDSRPPGGTAPSASPSQAPAVSAKASPTAASASTQAAPAPDAPCPADMVLIAGNACTDAAHHCEKWLDDPKLPYARCGRYRQPAECAGRRVPFRFCIDKEELVLPGEALPEGDLNFIKADKLCRSGGKRLCLESEWNFACEGEEMRPYPYGWERRPVCNQDREDLVANRAGKQTLVDHRAPVSAYGECMSPFGVHNLVGNVDELVRRDKHFNPRFRNALKGGWWMAGRNRCRPSTASHDDYFHELQVGTRCCADVPVASSAPEHLK